MDKVDGEQRKILSNSAKDVVDVVARGVTPRPRVHQCDVVGKEVNGHLTPWVDVSAERGIDGLWLGVCG